MLRDLIVAYLNSFKTEAELYASFEALLHAMGYSHVHLLHGPNEFGKDLIGRRDRRQWAFQLKHGDVGLRAWRHEIQGQCLEMFTTDAGHADYDRSRGLTGCLVLNGRLKAGAMDRPRQFKSSLPRKRDEFEVWDQDRLAELLEQNLPALGTHSFALRYGHLEHSLRAGKAGLAEIEQYTGSWWETVSRDPSTLNSVAIEACISARLLSQCGLQLLAPYMLLGAMRVAIADTVARRQPEPPLLSLLARILLQHVSELAGSCLSRDGGLKRVLLDSAEAMFGTACRGLLLAELVCLAVELCPDAIASETEPLRRLFEELRSLPVLHRMLSDRYGVSVLLVAKRISDWESPEAASLYLRRVACECNNFLDRGGLGLASPYARVDEEVWRYMAPETEACQYERRPDTFGISACLDALSELGDEESIGRVLQDTRAVSGIPTRIVPNAGANALFFAGNDAKQVMLHDLHLGVQEAQAQHNAHVAQYPSIDKIAPGLPSACYWVVAALLRDRWHPQLLQLLPSKAK